MSLALIDRNRLDREARTLDGLERSLRAIEEQWPAAVERAAAEPERDQLEMLIEQQDRILVRAGVDPAEVPGPSEDRTARVRDALAAMRERHSERLTQARQESRKAD